MDFNKIKPDKPDDDDSWGTSWPALAETGLDAVLKHGENPTEKEKPFSQVGLRIALKGFRAIIRDIAPKYHMSYSMFARLSLKHGAAILNADKRIKTLKVALVKVRKAALDSGEPQALATLDHVGQYSFVHAQVCRTTLSVRPAVHGQLTDIADICGVEVTTIAVIAVVA